MLCFGAEAARYRVELYPSYHAARPPVPPELQWQFEHAPGFFAQFGWPSMTSEGLEADDLLGSLAAVEGEAGSRTLILTGDRDMYQCAGVHTAVLYLRSGKSGFEEVDGDEVLRRYGVAPALVPDFIALRGDPSDGLPGAPGIGAKTAAQLLARHGSLEAAIAAADGERPRVAAALRQSADQLLAFKRIAELQRVALERPQDARTDLAAGAAAAQRYGLEQLSRRLLGATSLDQFGDRH
jgi:DNA polymerase-1